MRFNISQIIYLFTCSLAFLALSTQPAFGIELLPYFKNTSGNSVTTGEYFKAEDAGSNSFKILKSTNSAYYEQFRYDNNYIYHVEDTTWATETGDVMCTDTGNEAKLAYSDRANGTKWVARNMSVGSCFNTTGEVVGVDEVTNNQCPAPFTGSFNRQICLTHQGCIKFPNGTASADGVALEIKQGPGAGEQFFYDAKAGWIGFNRGTEGTGAYITNDISGQANSLTGCLEVKIKASKCPRGYTCPDTSYKTVFGEVVKHEATTVPGLGAPSLSGPTGPQTNQLRFPDYSQEDDLFTDADIIKRSMPYEQIKRGYPMFEDASLKGFVGHSGCGRTTVEGADVGPAKIEQDLRDDSQRSDAFPATNSFNELLTRFRFWESQYVDGKRSSAKIKTVQPEDVPDVPDNRENCNNRDGEPLNEATTVNNPTPPSANILSDVFAAISGKISEIFNNALNLAGLSATVSVQVQQEKYLPGEITLMEEGVNFLNSFVPYEEARKPVVDQEEINSYQILGKNEEVGVNFAGAKTVQQRSLDLVKSLRPYEEAKGITTIGSTAGLPTVNITNLNFKVPYRDSTVEISQETKAKIIKQVLAWKPDSQISSSWETVYNTAKIAGINPAFMIAIWIEESAASSPTAAGAGPAYSDFGCFPGGNPNDITSFERSMSCFVNFTTSEHPNDFAEWVKYFCGPLVDPICSNNRNFLRNFKAWYDFIIPAGNPGAAQPL